MQLGSDNIVPVEKYTIISLKNFTENYNEKTLLLHILIYECYNQYNNFEVY